MKKKNETLAIRIDGVLKREIAAAARADDRSVTSLVRRLLRQYLQQTRTEKK